jgi:hypothetical protein
MQKGGFGLKKSLEAGLFIGRGNNGDENRTVSLPGEEHRVALLIPYAMSPVSTYDIHAEIIFVVPLGHGFLTLVVFCFY